MPEAHAPTASAAQLSHPFRWTQRDKNMLAVEVDGRVPPWLTGTLMRTAPAEFERGGLPVEHWFDGHGLIYAFEFGQAVHFRQQLLASNILAENDRGQSISATFATSMRRNLLQRLLAPIPKVSDNTNVNIVPWEGHWLAMTETQHQHVIDPDTLKTRGHYRYTDRLPSALAMTAHPHYDSAHGAMVNIGTAFGPKSDLLFFRHHKNSGKRELEGRLSLARVPYVHAFGLTPKASILIDHPLRMNALHMLFSNKGFIRHFAWEPGATTRLLRLDRSSGAFRSHETEALFCFHTVNAFEDGADTVFDFLAYEDPRVIDQLYTDVLARELPNVMPRLVRARLSPGKRDVTLQALSDARFEFPQIAYRSHQGQPYRYVFGTGLGRDAELGLRSEILKVDLEHGDVRRYVDEEFTFGEPVCVPRPGAEREDDGVLLAVGSSAHQERSRLLILDASTLEPLCRCDVPALIPLGFHGTFAFAA